MLNSKDQKIAQELFNHVDNNGGIVCDESRGWSIVTITSRRKRGSSMELCRDANDVGHVTLKLRKGKRFWQDDGYEGFTGFLGKASMIAPEKVYLTMAMRDKIIKEIHDVFIPRQLQLK
ncbi:MAG: hypothetical protein HW400_143 [Candidatus Levybacteria bacterium]|nr:hypothetical protein [Candidatus Levybacteria bacterium]